MRIALQNVARAALVAAFLLSGCAFATAQDSQTQPDNTRVNQRDRSPDEATADQQKANRSDRDITQQIRRSIAKDKSISTYGHNVKVITQNGMVTLKGPVRSEDEKQSIESKAAEIAGGNDKINDQMEIKPQQ
ncbi:MAG: BON domain-containing protein [Terriglobales bacterium]